MRSKPDTTSMWAVAAAIALPPFPAAGLLTIVALLVWARQYRPGGPAAYRAGRADGARLLGGLAASSVLHTWSGAWDGLPWALGELVSVLLAITIVATANRTLGLAGTVSRRLGTREENRTELASLCLGGLLGAAALHDPWLCVLVLAPLVALQRGARVRELETAALTDAKTGLLNAIAWDQVAHRELARARRTNTPAAVLIIDVDRFKRVNDTYGHLVGDGVLRAIGRQLKANVREYDTVGRFGGEEFVAVLPEASEAQALGVAERLRARISALSVATLVDGLGPENDAPLSVSIGVACAPGHGDQLAALFRAADAALYRAKAAGRNRVALANLGVDDVAARAAAD